MKLPKLLLFFALLMTFCQKKERAGENFKFEVSGDQLSADRSIVRQTALSSKGVGHITEVKIDSTINMDLVSAGADIFSEKCRSCHLLEQKFIGPPLQGVTRRRSPEWVMNMILNPDQMLAKDSMAMRLFMEYNGVPMSNMGLSAEEARQVYEYLRTTH